MNRSLLSVGIAASWMACSAVVSSGAGTGERYARPVEIPEFERDELVAASLDADVYAATELDYADLRLLNDADEETAFILRKVVDRRSRASRQSFTVERPMVRPLDDGGLEITFEVDQEKHPQTPLGVTLVTPLENFERHVAVSASVDGANWQPLLADGLVFDYSQFMDVRNHELKFDAAVPDGARRYRIIIDDVTQEQQSQLLELTRRLQGDDETGRTERILVNRQPFRIDRIECWYEIEVVAAAADRLQDYSLAAVRTENDVEAKATFVVVESRGEPLTEFTVVTPDHNFSRAARVEVPVDKSPPAELEWGSPVGASTLERFEIRNLRRENLHLDFPESRRRQHRLVVLNGDSAPLTVSSITARGHAYEVVFLAKAGQAYRLAYGGGGLDVPNYDVAAVQTALAEGFDPVVATLGEQVVVPAAPRPVEPALTRLLNDPRFLGGLIALFVAALGVGLYRATRRLDSLPPQDDRES